MVFSGSTLVEKDRVIALYPGIGIGKPNPRYSRSRPRHDGGHFVRPAIAQLEEIRAGGTIPDVCDADIWKQGDTYYGVVGGIERYYPEAR